MNGVKGNGGGIRVENRQPDSAGFIDLSPDSREPFSWDVTVEAMLADFDAHPECKRRATHRPGGCERGHGPPGGLATRCDKQNPQRQSRPAAKKQRRIESR